MLVIKKKQIEQFIAEDDTQLIRVISEIIREAFFDSLQEYSGGTVDSMVKIGIERAKSHDLSRAEDIAAFVALMFEISPAFDTNEAISMVLQDPTIASEDKFEQLLGRTNEATWLDAEKTYDSTIWFPDSAVEEK